MLENDALLEGEAVLPKPCAQRGFVGLVAGALDIGWLREREDPDGGEFVDVDVDGRYRRKRKCERGDASPNAGAARSGFDRSFTALGEFAAREADRAMFAASDWGVGTQLYCYTGGDPRGANELFWDYHGPDQIEQVWRESGKPELYLVRLDPPSAVREDATRRIEADAIADRRWRQIPVPREVEGLSRVRVMRFVRRGTARDP